MDTTDEKIYKIFVVDDNGENIRIIGNILRQNAYQVGFATSGKQALDILLKKEEAFDLVLLDVNMPGINGYEVCRSLRQELHLNELPVIFLTANAEPEQVIEGFSSGGQDYVTKPFHAGELLARIGIHIELKEKRLQLKQVNAILEEKVKERTRDLEQANKKLESANFELKRLDEVKVEFLRIISHEINTPLNGVIGFTEILKKKLNSTEYFKYINFLSDSAQRLNEFAQISLLITEIRTKPENYKKEIVDLSKIMKEVIFEHQTEISNKNIQLDINHPVKNPTIIGNKTLINTCITQLLKNAIHYTPEGLSITTQLYNEKKRIFVSIDDSGPGFSEKALQTQFAPFSIFESQFNNNKGLGLSLAKMIVDFHQGQIEICNKSSFGAKVVLSFDEIEN